MKKFLKIAICDDDPDSGRSLRDFIYDHAHYPCHIDYFDQEEHLIVELNKEEVMYHILLMDVRFGNKHGVDIAKKIKKAYPYLQFIFMSGYVEDVFQIFEVSSLYFLNKNDFGPHLNQALKQAVKAIEQTYLTITFRKEIYQIPMDEIYYMERNLRITEIHTKDKIYYTSDALPQIMEYLPYYFSMCNRSYIVNLHYVNKISRNAIFMTNEISISLSNTYRESFRSKYSNYVRDMSCGLAQE